MMDHAHKMPHRLPAGKSKPPLKRFGGLFT
jgi:hypothetical protein